MGNFTARYPGQGAGNGSGGVTSLNGEVGDLTLTAGTGIAITTPTSTTIQIASNLTFGNLTDVGTDGITITGGTGAVIGSGTSISQHVADTTHNGYLSSTDWNTFNSKQAALTIGNITDAGTDGITITGGTGAVIGSGVSLSQHVADASHNGYLSSTDWSTFNSKQAAGSYVTAASNLTTVGAVPYVSASGVINQDPTNFFWDASNHRLGIGVATPSAPFDVHVPATNNAIQANNVGTQGSTAGAIIAVGSDPGAAMSSGSRLGQYTFFGTFDNTSTLSNAASIQAFATQSWTSSAKGSQIKFFTVPNSATTQTLALTIGQDQTATFASTISATGANFSGLSASLPVQTDGSKNLISAAIDLSGSQATGTLAAGRFPALTGDVTTSAGSLATTIGSNKVANSQLAQMAANTIKGNNTGSTANAVDMTVAQLNTLIGRNVYLAATSSSKTGITGSTYMQMTGNKVTLTAGSWLVSGVVEIGNDGTSPQISEVYALWAAANGNDTGTPPSSISVDAGDTQFGNNGLYPTNCGFAYVPSSVVRVTVAVNTDIYLVPLLVVAGTISHANAKTLIYAERVG